MRVAILPFLREVWNILLAGTVIATVLLFLNCFGTDPVDWWKVGQIVLVFLAGWHLARPKDWPSGGGGAPGT
jgi:hypothetical protein